MSGVIVVTDPPGTLSDSMKAMREVVMVLQETNLESGESAEFSPFVFCYLFGQIQYELRDRCISFRSRNTYGIIPGMWEFQNLSNTACNSLCLTCFSPVLVFCFVHATNGHQRYGRIMPIIEVSGNS